MSMTHAKLHEINLLIDNKKSWNRSKVEQGADRGQCMITKAVEKRKP